MEAALENQDLDWMKHVGRQEEVYQGGFIGLNTHKTSDFGNTELRPSDFVRIAFRISDENGVINQFSFEGRRHMFRPYNTPADRVLLCTARQVEKTQVLTAPILMANGDIKQAGDVVVGDTLACLDHTTEDTLMTCAPVEWVSKRYTKPCLRIRTRQGHVLEVATTHPIRLFGRWVEAGEVVVGDRVAAIRRSGSWGVGVQPVPRVVLTALLIGDGSLPGPSQVSFTSLPGPVFEEFALQVQEINGSYRSYNKKGTKAVSARLRSNRQLTEWLSSDGLFGTKAATKTIPLWVFDLPRDQTALFINRLWATDGHVKKNSPSKYSIEYCSMSWKLVRQLQALLWKFGIPSAIRENWPAIYKKRGEKRLAYLLRVETQEGVRRFLEEIGALGKSENIPRPDSKQNNNRDTLPHELVGIIQQLAEQCPVPLSTEGLRRTPEHTLTKEKLARYVAFFSKYGVVDRGLLGRLSAQLTSDIYWDTVVSVEPIGHQLCVDFMVREHHNFIIDGVVTHNSTLLGNTALTYACLIPGYKTLYVSPSATQTKTFSNDRLREPIETSEVLKAYTTPRMSMNIFEKQFINWSKITLRYAFLTADRVRGIPSYGLMLDEIQDIIKENIPVIEQCTAHAPRKLKRFRYAGTPKSLDNVLEYYRANFSTQGEWVVPCDFCGSKSGAGRYWNILGEKNIGLKGLICERCGKPLNPQHPEAQWAFMVAYDAEKVPFESYRIPQLMVPWKPWGEILLDYRRYPRNQFYNEVLGLSFDSGIRPLTLTQVRNCCDAGLSMDEETLLKFEQLGHGQDIFMGIDWGCHDEETRILTPSGWKYFRDLTEEDRVAQWDPDTREITFVTPRARTVRNWEGDLFHFKTRGGLDLMVTETHRMRVRSTGGWTTETAKETAERTGGYNFVGYGTWGGREESTFTLPGVPGSAGYSGEEALTIPMDLWLEFLGYLVTEGGVCYNDGRPSCVKMSQRETVNPDTTARIRAVLSALTTLGINVSEFPNPSTGDVNWTLYGKRLWSWVVATLGSTPETKRLPREIFELSTRQLQILFNAMVAGDGSRDNRNPNRGGYYSTSKGLCEDFQEICLRLGLRAVVRPGRGPMGNKQQMWRVSWSRGRDHRINPTSHPTRAPYRGKVYCCSVPSGYILTERNGCVAFQGNSGENTYTVVTLATYIDMKFTVFYVHRFVGEDLEPPRQLEKLVGLVRRFNVKLIGSDYGGGFDRNDHLTRVFGPEKLAKYQYMARTKQKVAWDPSLRRYKVHRTEIMSDLFNAIKRNQLVFPRWEEFGIPYGQDMCNIYSEYNESLRQIQYDTTSGNTDDTFHSILYCLLASMIIVRRPDIIAPRRETGNAGPQFGASYTGPTNQG